MHVFRIGAISPCDPRSQWLTADNAQFFRLKSRRKGRSQARYLKFH